MATASYLLWHVARELNDEIIGIVVLRTAGRQGAVDGGDGFMFLSIKRRSIRNLHYRHLLGVLKMVLAPA